MRVRKSGLLTRLDANIKDARNPVERTCFILERAAYLARLGNFAEVATAVDATHRNYDSRPNFEVSVWLHLVEGLSSHFRDMSGKAHDSLMRANAISAAVNMRRLHAISAAWLAHMNYARLDIESTVKHLLEARRVADSDNHSAHSRIALVAAQALHLANRLDIAAYWYGAAHKHATEEGDDATISAILHNRAWLQMSSLRHAKFRSSPDHDIKHALISVESTENFDRIVGSLSLKGLAPILRAQVLSIQDQPSAALEIYDSELEYTNIQGMNRLEANILADRAWCRLRMGQIDNALSDARLAEASITAQTQVDDKAAVHSRLAEVYDALGHLPERHAQSLLADEAWTRHEAMQMQIVELLGNLHQ